MIIRDKKWLLSLRDEPCIFTSQRGDDNESVVAHHIGGGGMGMKASDDLALPMLQRHHQQVHQHGEASTYRKLLPDRTLIAMAKAYARELYAEASPSDITPEWEASLTDPHPGDEETSPKVTTGEDK